MNALICRKKLKRVPPKPFVKRIFRAKFIELHIVSTCLSFDLVKCEKFSHIGQT